MKPRGVPVLLLFLIGFFLRLAPIVAEEIWDPIEPVNRGIFWFNDTLDVYILEPVARGYKKVIPGEVQDGVGNFFDNLKYPAALLSDVVQFKFGQALDRSARFLINSTVGILGLFDVAKHFGLERHKEDFGIALAFHNLPPGPYLVLPLLGPSNLRDGFGKLVDTVVDPFTILTYSDVSSDVSTAVVLGSKTVEFIDARAGLLDAVEAAKESSIDYYLFIQSAYYQNRRGILYDGEPPEEEELDFGEDQGDENDLKENQGSDAIKGEGE